MSYYKFITHHDNLQQSSKTEKDIINRYLMKNKLPQLIDEIKVDSTNIADAINELVADSSLIIVHWNILGKTSKKIIENLQNALKKNITIHIAKMEMSISAENKELLSLIQNLFDIDNYSKRTKIEAATQTRQNNGTKLGRKAGMKTKSMFDRHKRFIMKQDKQGVPKSKILESIKIINLELKDSSSQALGQYIKKVKLKKAAEELAKNEKTNMTFNKASTRQEDLKDAYKTNSKQISDESTFGMNEKRYEAQNEARKKNKNNINSESAL